MKNKKKTVEKHDLHVKAGDRVILISGKDKYDKDAKDAPKISKK